MIFLTGDSATILRQFRLCYESKPVKWIAGPNAEGTFGKTDGFSVDDPT
jgi:hypothetical protein